MGFLITYMPLKCNDKSALKPLLDCIESVHIL